MADTNAHAKESLTAGLNRRTGVGAEYGGKSDPISAVAGGTWPGAGVFASRSYGRERHYAWTACLPGSAKRTRLDRD